MRLLILETIHKGVQTASRHGASLPYRSHAGVLSTVMFGDSTPMRQLTVETIYDEAAGYDVTALVSRTQTAALHRPGIGMDANAHPCPTVSRICCLTDSLTSGAGWRQCRPSSDTGCQRGVSQGTPRANTPMRLLILEIVDGETTGKRAAWSLSAATWARHCPL